MGDGRKAGSIGRWLTAGRQAVGRWLTAGGQAVGRWFTADRQALRVGMQQTQMDRTKNVIFLDIVIQESIVKMGIK